MSRRIKTQHTADVLTGNRAPNDLSKTLPFDPDEVALISGGIVFEGRVVHVNDMNQWALGVGDQTCGWLLMNNSDDLDVWNDGGDPTTEPDAWVSANPTQAMKAVCLLNGSEFETTEFDSTLTYLPNEPLTAPLSTGSAATMLSTSGKLTNSGVAYYADNVVGFVSERRSSTSANNSNFRPSLKFIGQYVPKDLR